MTNRPDSNSEDPRPHGEESPPEAAAPPPPPETTQDDDLGLATEMVFSGEQREQLRNAPAYETLETGELSLDDEELSQNTAAPTDSGDHQTQLKVTADHTNVREAPQAYAMSSNTASNSAEQSDYGNFQAQSFEPNREVSQRSGTTNEPLALVMFIILTLTGLGILGVLLWLMYRLLTGG